MATTYRTALIGCGRMGATIDDEARKRGSRLARYPYAHAAAAVACDRTELVAVSDVLREKAEEARVRYDVPTAYTDYREMIEKEKPDIVCIATRPATHAEMVVFAAEHGVKGMYCEKPLCCSMAEADTMTEAVEKHGVRFNYGTQRRFFPIYNKIREYIDRGELGTILGVIAQQGISSALWGLTHGSDLLYYLAGDPEVEFVHGTITYDEANLDGNRLNEDPAIVSGYVKFANGVHGYFTSGTGIEYEVCGTEGKLRTYNDGSSCTFRKTAAEERRVMDEAPFPSFERVSGTLSGLLDTVRALDTGTETLGPIRFARSSQEILMGIIDCHLKGGVRIPLPMENRSLYVGRDNW